MKNLFVMLFGLAVVLTAVRCTTDERPVPVEVPSDQAGPGGDAVHHVPGLGFRFELHKPRTDCRTGLGMCIEWDFNSPPSSATPVFVTVNGATNVLRISFEETYANPTNDTFEIADPDVFQALASDLGYTQIEVVPGDYVAVHHQGTLNVDYVDIPIQTLN